MADRIGTESWVGRLVGVHGIAKHHSGRHQLLQAWIPALADGLERACGHRVSPPELDLAFYGDLYLPSGAGSPVKSPEAESGLDDLDDDEWAEISEELRAAVTAADIAAAEAQEAKAYTRFPRPVQVLLRATDRRFGAAAGVLYVGVLRQVRRYLRDPQVKAQVDARVEQAVDEHTRVLIGHSLGSVVAYEYLRRHQDHRIELFLTLGSPLGLRMVRSRLPEPRPLAVPTWVNVRDPHDPVACAGALHRWWPQLLGRDLPVRNGGDTHAVERYLSRRTTGEVLLEALTEPASG